MDVTPATPADAGALARLLVACVDAGASVGFLGGLDVGEASRWWAAWLERPDTITVVTRATGGITGTASLVLATQPNGRHRAEVAEVLVHPAVRRGGLGRALLRAVEAEAVGLGRTTLLLDTVTGAPAQRLYEGQGWSVVGEVPAYAAATDGRLEPTAFLTKRV